MIQAHSYTGRIAPDFPFITYLPPKPGMRPCGGYREAEKPVCLTQGATSATGLKAYRLDRTQQQQEAESRVDGGRGSCGASE